MFALRPLEYLLLTITFLAPATLRADERLEALEEQAFREAAAIAEPSIVRIETVGGLDLVSGRLTASGPTTGVVVGEDGWIITSSFNFASRPSSILVTTPDGQRYPATMTASDKARMLTLLKIDATGLTPIAAAPREEIRVGQWAIALGRTFDQPFPNISVGIVSALDRIWGKALQTDAKTSPTNYGGPLVDVRGRALGVIVPLDPQKSDATAGVEWYDSGIGFAVPMEDIYAVLERLQSGEDLKPGRMGIIFQDLGPTAGEPLVDRVRAGSPAYDAGLRTGDRITQVNGTPVARVPQVRQLLGRKYAGDTIAVTYVRGDTESAGEMTLVAELEPYEAPLLGILPDRAARDPEAVVGADVRFVLPESAAAEGGVQRQDVITKINEEAVSDANALRAAMGHLDPEDTIELTVQREGAEQTLSITLGAMNADTPDDLPSAAVVAPEEADRQNGPQTGRWVDTLDGDSERAFWAYVPADYNPNATYGLVIWLHPSGDTKEAEVLKTWQAHCDRRGLILVGPKTAQPSGWAPSDIDFITDLTEDIRERYSIDPWRIVLHSFGDASTIAAAVAFRERDTFRGLSLTGASLRTPPPEVDPEHPFQFHFLCGDKDPLLESAEKVTAALHELKYPVALTTVPDLAHEYPPAEAVAAIARWIDALDRI